MTSPQLQGIDYQLKVSEVANLNFVQKPLGSLKYHHLRVASQRSKGIDSPLKVSYWLALALEARVTLESLVLASLVLEVLAALVLAVLLKSVAPPSVF